MKILFLPVKKNKFGKRVKDISTTDYYRQIAEEVLEAHNAAQILFEPEGLCRNFETCRQQTQATAPPLAAGSAYGIGRDAFNCGQNAKFALSLTRELQPPLTARGAGAVFDSKHVRRLTPLECERLQGLPDNWTFGGSDSQRYKALGNAMAQPVADFIFSNLWRCFNGKKT